MALIEPLYTENKGLSISNIKLILIFKFPDIIYSRNCSKMIIFKEIEINKTGITDK